MTLKLSTFGSGSPASTIETLDSQEKYAAVNFSGQYSASYPCFREPLADHVATVLQPDSVLDVGCGNGSFANSLRERGINAYAVDGCDYGLDNGKLKIADAYYAVADFAQPIDDPRLEKLFDLTTCFECLEHVPRHHLYGFLSNLRFVSKRSFVSLHVAGKESGNHCTIDDIATWQSRFRLLRSSFAVVNPTLSPGEWRDSVFALIQW